MRHVWHDEASSVPVPQPPSATVPRLEGINNKIKVIKRQAYGFRNDACFILKIKGAFQGKLQLNPR
jgi:hypothetical protein